MRLDAFEAALDSYGADLGVWPESLRARGLALLKASPEAHELLDAEIRLRAELSRRTQVRAPAGLADRIAARAFEISPVPAESAADSHVPTVMAPLAAQIRSKRLFGAPQVFFLSVFFLIGFVMSQSQTTDETALSFDGYYATLPI